MLECEAPLGAKEFDRKCSHEPAMLCLVRNKPTAYRNLLILKQLMTTPWKSDTYSRT